MHLIHPFNIGIYGKPRSGKTTLIKHLIISNLLQFDYIVVISGTKFSKNFHFLKELGIRYTMLDTIKLNDKLKILLDNQEKTVLKEKEHNMLIIFDDVMGLFKSCKYSQYINASYRHYNVSLIFSFQAVTGNDSKSRTCHNHAFLFKMKNKQSYEHFKDNFLFEYKNAQEVYKYLMSGLRKPYVFLYIDLDEDNKKFCILT